jgi:hypothetical protein
MALFFRLIDGVDPSLLTQHGGLDFQLKFEANQTPWLWVTPLRGPPDQAETHPNAYPEKHPLYELACFAFKLNNRPFADAAVLDVFPHALTQKIMKRQKREQALADPLRYIAERAKGWTTVYLTSQADTLMERVKVDGTDRYIFGLTQVFPWAMHVLTECGPNCVEFDATFEIVEPYVLEILNVIVRNESLPIAQSIFPSETEESYRRLYDHVEEVAKTCGVKETILKELPAVTDQGSGGSALAASLALEQKLCHAHLTRNAGTKSAQGDWVSSLLHSNSPEECIRTALRVRADIKQLSEAQGKRFRDPKNYQLVKRMLDAIQFELGVDLKMDWQLMPRSLGLCAWARWLRLGCPTTTNAEESIHRWLNELRESLRNAHLWTRWEAVCDFLEGRFNNRNSEVRINNRTARDWVSERAKLVHPLNATEQARFNFMEALFSAGGQPVNSPRWKFPDFEVPDISQFTTKLVNDTPPRSWTGDRAKIPGDAPDLGASCIEVPEDPVAILDLSRESDAKAGHCAAASRIIKAMHRLISSHDWETTFGWSTVISTVFRVGSCYEPAEVTPDIESTWKFAVIKELGISLNI